MAEKWETASSTGESLKNLLRLQKATNSSDELEQLEQLMRSVSRDQNTRDNFRLHSHFRLVYSVFNGQSYNTESTNLSTSPLFGLIQVYGKLILPFLMPLNLIRQNIHNQRGRASEIFSTVGMIPLVINPYSDSFIWYFDNSTGRILCPRLDLVSDDYSGYYVVADDIFRLLELAGRLITATADRIDQNEEMYFISGFTNPVNKRTDSYNIVVRTAFLFGESAVTPPQYHYAYEIIQSMDKDAPADESMKLERRYWKIDDLAGNIDEVDGPGVIGEYPVLKPGSFHKYCSRTSFEVERGEMGGFFTYRKLHKNRSFLLHTPKFTLQVPPMIEED